MTWQKTPGSTPANPKRPDKLTAEKLFLLFLNLSEQRYISSETCLKEADNFINAMGGAKLPEIDKVQAKIIILQQMRDSIQQSDPTRVFRSGEHRDEVKGAIIEACEVLENRLADLEEELQE